MQPYRLPPAIDEQLRLQAQRTGRTLAQVTRAAVLDEIEALEAYYLARALKTRQAPSTTTGTRGARAHISS